ncbi:MAG: NAD(P)/FAD-dependent oxidoreductase [Streptosporangiaceae bacterium]
MQAEFVVVGAGIVGASIAMQLGRRSAGDVVLVDARGPAAGMSGRSFRQVRTHYSNEVTTRLAHRGIEILRGWSDHIGVGDSGYQPVGYLLAVAEDQAEGCAANVALGRSLGVCTELIPADRLRDFEPLLAIDGLACGAWEPDSGLFDPVKATLSATTAAQMAGVRTMFGTPVRALRMNGDGVTGIVTSEGDISAGTVVLAVGPWAPPLLAGIGIDLGMRLHTLELSVLRRPPALTGLTTAVTHAPSGLVARCDNGPFAVAVAYPAEADQPDQPQDASVAADAEPRLRRALTAALPAMAAAEVVSTIAGVYDVSPDWHPMLGPWPGLDGLYLAVGFSGHGLKLAPAVGEAIADELAGRQPAIDITPLRPSTTPRPLGFAYGPGARA